MLLKRKRERTLINAIKNKTGYISTDTADTDTAGNKRIL